MHRLGWVLLAGFFLLAACGRVPPPVASEGPPALEEEAPLVEEEVNPSPAQEEEETAGALAYPFAVVVDNLAAARPQSGLEGAAVVVEGLAEGGITRYFAVFTHDPGTAIGPVRSARIYFNRLAHLWGLPVAHVGGNKDALEDWNRYPAYDIDDIRRGGGAFYRIQDRKAPHSTYTTAERVQKVLAGRSLPPAQLEFSRGPLPEGGEPVAGVELSYRQAKQVYRVEWHYEEGEWRRYLDGKSDRSADGVVLTAANVLVMVAPVRPKEDPWTAGAIDIDFEHPRKAWLLREGVVTACRVEWTANGLRLTSLLPAGSDLPLSRGNLWIQWVKEEGDVAWLDSNG